MYFFSLVILELGRKWCSPETVLQRVAIFQWQSRENQCLSSADRAALKLPTVFFNFTSKSESKIIACVFIANDELNYYNCLQCNS